MPAAPSPTRRLVRVLAAAAALGTAAAAPSATAERDGVSVSTVRGGAAAACGDVAVRDLAITGGCFANAATARVRFSIFSLFGRLDLADCDVSFSLSVGRTGELAIDSLTVLGPPLPSGAACGDILACRVNPRSPDSEPKPPWRGTIHTRAGGSPYADVDMCFDTCLGRYAGRTRLTLERTHGRGWRVAADAAAVGASGMRVDGSWHLEPLPGERLQIR